MTIENQTITADHANNLPYTDAERAMVTAPATPAQIKYIMTLLWNKGAIKNEFKLPASTPLGIPTAADLAQYNKRQASNAIEMLKNHPVVNRGMIWHRKALASDKFGYSATLGDLTDIDADI